MNRYILPDGRVDLEYVSGLSRDELCLFMRNVLIPENNRSGVPEAGYPHLLLTQVYRSLPAFSRVIFQEVVIELIKELGRKAILWHGDPGDELLLLAEDIFAESPNKEEAIGALLELVRFEGSAVQIDSNLRL